MFNGICNRINAGNVAGEGGEMSEVKEYGEWGSILVCSNCGSGVGHYHIYTSQTCWNCGAVGEILLSYTRVSRRKVVTGYKGFWPFKKEIYHYEYKEQTVPKELRGSGKFNPMVKSGLTRTAAIGLAGIGTGLF